MAPRRTGSHQSEATCEAFASRRRDRSVDPGRQYSLAHQASARLNMLAEKDTAASIAEGPVRRLNARRPSHIGPFWVRIISFAASQTVPGKGTWDRTPLGLETATPCQPRAALAVEGSGKTQVPSASKVPALHREAERDTTGSISRQHPVHTWIGGCVQGKREGTRHRASQRGNTCSFSPIRPKGLINRVVLMR